MIDCRDLGFAWIKWRTRQAPKILGSTPANTTVAAQIDVASINMGDEKRDAHLKSPDFFDAEHYPHLTFHSTRVDVKDKTHAVLYGDLIIRDVPREVALDVEFNGLATL